MSDAASSTAVDPLFLSLQEALAGHYALERELGRGGMAVVYLARDVRLDRPVAIKLLPPDLAAHDKLRDRFMREARTAARLSHPHIVPIHAVDEVRGYLFYVMSYVDGETLAERVANRGPLPPREASRLLQQVAGALAAAHGQGVVHRDVKPGNILLERATGARARGHARCSVLPAANRRRTAPVHRSGAVRSMGPSHGRPRCWTADMDDRPLDRPRRGGTSPSRTSTTSRAAEGRDASAPMLPSRISADVRPRSGVHPGLFEPICSSDG